MQNFGPGKDLDIDSSLDLSMVSGADHTVMKIRQRLQTFQGEWWINPTLGMPYYQSIIGQINPDLDALRGIYIAAIAVVPGVKSVDSLTVSFDRASRTYSVDFSATDNNGATISDEVTL